MLVKIDDALYFFYTIYERGKFVVVCETMSGKLIKWRSKHKTGINAREMIKQYWYRIFADKERYIGWSKYI